MVKQYPTFKEFTSGNYDTNFKMSYIAESMNDVPFGLIYYNLVNSMNSDDFAKFQESIDTFKNNVNKVNEGITAINEFSLDLEDIMADSEEAPEEPSKPKKKQKDLSVGHGNPTGKGDRSKGGLKALVGKPAGKELDKGDTNTIGEKIAAMEKEGSDEYQEHIGMVNFLGASCRIYGEIVDVIEKIIGRNINYVKLAANYSPTVQQPTKPEPEKQEPEKQESKSEITQTQPPPTTKPQRVRKKYPGRKAAPAD